MSKIALAAAVAFVVIGGPPAFANQADEDARVDKMFATADANHDGVVTRAELLSAQAAKFAELDRDHDGYLTLADAPAAVAVLHPGMPRLKSVLARFDTDGDGRVSRAEFLAGVNQIFDLADANHDGKVTRDEARAAGAKVRALLPPAR